MKKNYSLLVFILLTICVNAQNPFVTAWEVAGNSSSSLSIEIPTLGSGYNYTVDFGDATTPITNVSGNITHTYSTPGIYYVSITGDFPRIYFPNIAPYFQLKIKSVEQWGDIQWVSMESAFKGCDDLVINAIDSPNLNQVNDMSYMFYEIDSILQSINNWDVSNVIDMSYMFYEIDSINSSLSDWDVSNVINMSYMFSGGEFNNQPLNLDNWDVSSVTDMSYMFASGTNSFNESLNSWDVSNVVNMEGMFYNNNVFNQPLNNWDVSSVTNMEKLFYDTPFNHNINGWNVSNVENMKDMFFNIHSFNQPLNNWDVSNVVNMESMFRYCISFNQPLNNWDVSSVTNMEKMFSSCNAFNQPLDNWDVSSVTTMSNMFFRAFAFNQSLNNWSVISVTDMQSMFQDATSFNSLINNWDVSNVLNMKWMFSNASSFNLPLDSWDVSNTWNLYGMFKDASSFNQDLSTWDFYNFNGYIDLRDFISSSNVDVSNYDKLLLNLANSGIDDEEFGVGGLEYCNVDSRNYLLNHGWIFYYDSLSTSCNTILGSIYYDNDSNGCANSDIELSNYFVSSENSTNTYSTLVNNGFYELSVYSGNYNVSLLNIPSYFTVSPQNTLVDFTTSSTEQIDFCLTANQTIEDLNITILPIDDARPGFEANYKLVLENVGTETINGVTANLTFDDSKQSFVSANPAPVSTTSNSLDFSVGTIQPFGSFEIEIVMQTFTPPTVNADDVLNFTAIALPNASDYTPNDNVYDLSQIVVNAYDPNDKRVLQGNEITLDQTNEYLDYIIRFQNTGSANATFVRIEDELDTELDWNTLKIVSASHAYDVKITNGNEVEFLFNNINLPYEAADEPNSHGYIAYKIKPKATVQVGDIMSGNASIYFDFNTPIITNTVSTEVITNLSVDEFGIKNLLSIYPNPTDEGVFINTKDGVTVNSVKLYNIQGTELRSIEGSTEFLNTKKIASGIYVLVIKTNRGNITKKLVVK